MNENLNDYPSWMKDGLKKCTCQSPVLLHYDEHQNYHVQCSNCKKQVKFKATSSEKAKHIWNLFALIRYKYLNENIYICNEEFMLPTFDEHMKMTEQTNCIPMNSIWILSNEIGESDFRLHKIVGAIQSVSFIDITKDTFNQYFNTFA